MLRSVFQVPGQNPGTGTNDNAAAGAVGQVLSASLASGSAITLSVSLTIYNIISLALTAGDWDVDGQVDVLAAATGTVTAVNGGANATTASLTGQDTATQLPGLAVPASGLVTLPVPTQRFSLSGPATVYLNVSASWTVAAATAYGSIRARRMR